MNIENGKCEIESGLRKSRKGHWKIVFSIKAKHHLDHAKYGS